MMGRKTIFYLERTPVRKARRCVLFLLVPSPLEVR
jgi:hypothetical protein